MDLSAQAKLARGTPLGGRFGQDKVLADRLQFLGIAQMCCALDRPALQHLSDLKYFPEILNRILRHEVPLPWNVRNKPLFLQLLDGFPDGRFANRKISRKNPFVDRLPWLHSIIINDTPFERLTCAQPVALPFVHGSVNSEWFRVILSA
jgi:hypothetical protein